jgi:membrane protein implicated in regulation of membrane protease activity
MNQRQTTGSSIGLAGALGLLFIGLKLTGYIGWSWWGVLAPLWIPAAAIVLFLLSLVVLFLIAGWVDYRERVRREQQMVDTQREREGQPRASVHGPAYRWGRRER